MENVFDNNYIKGKCMEMCPEEEVTLRKKEKIVHILEMVPGNNKVKKVDPDRMVKSYSRSAAGKLNDNPNNIRPPEVLLKTISYLLFDVISVDYVPWHVVYDFITDRLMSVRQDMVIQNVQKAESIAILQPIIRFHAYAAYRLSSEPINHFDPVLNNKHLLECLKKLLALYDAYDQILLEKYFNLETTMCDEFLIETRPDLEALYIILNLGNEEALQRAVQLPRQCKLKPVLNNATKISLCFRYGNYVRLCRFIKDLPPLLAIVAALHLPNIRRQALQTMAVAYSSKNCGFFLDDLRDILLYNSSSQLQKDCKHYEIEVRERYIYFNKQSFAQKKHLCHPSSSQFPQLRQNYIEVNRNTLLNNAFAIYNKLETRSNCLISKLTHENVSPGRESFLEEKLSDKNPQMLIFPDLA